MARSDTISGVSVSVALLLAETGSVVPDGAVTVALLTRFLLNEDLTVPVTVKMTELPYPAGILTVALSDDFPRLDAQAEFDLAVPSERHPFGQGVGRAVRIDVIDLPAGFAQARCSTAAVSLHPRRVAASKQPLGQLADRQALAGDLFDQCIGIAGFVIPAIAGPQS